MHWIASNLWPIWVLAALVLALLELALGDFWMLTAAAAALAGAVMSALGNGFWVSLVLALAVAALLAVVVRPRLLAKVSGSPGYESASDRIPGQDAFIIGVDTTLSGLPLAKVRLDDGDVWSARAEPGFEPLLGRKATVTSVCGAVLTINHHIPKNKED